MDFVDLTKELDKLNLETLPLLDKLLDEDLRQFISDLHGVLDRLNGMTITINIPNKKED
jgi:hypothetical protein